MTDISVSKIDEVNALVQTDDSGIRQELSEYFTFQVPGYQFMPSYRNKMWDGKIRLYSPVTRELYAGLASYVEKFAKERGYTVSFTDDFASTNFSLKEANEFIDTLNVPHDSRDYQVEYFAHCVRNHRALMLSPTASGKSLMAYLLTEYYASKTLIIVPTTSLVHQMRTDFIEYGMNEEDIHIIMGGKEKMTDRPVVISTWQSIYKLRKKFFEDFDVVIGDECHLFKAKSLTSIMTKLMNCKYRFGMTGTLDGTQTHKLVLEGLFGRVKKLVTTKQLIEQGHLSDFKIKALVLKYKDEEKKQVAKMKYPTEVDFIVTNERRNKFIKNLALSLNGNTLLLYQFVEKHGQVLYDLISGEAHADRKVFFVHGGTDAEIREEIRAITEKETNAIIIASFGTFSTGINIRNLHNLIFSSPTKSIIRVLQSIGRGLRKGSNKEYMTLFDIADDLRWKSKVNFALKHFGERVKIFSNEEFDYKIYNINL